MCGRMRARTYGKRCRASASLEGGGAESEVLLAGLGERARGLGGSRPGWVGMHKGAGHQARLEGGSPLSRSCMGTPRERSEQPCK